MHALEKALLRYFGKGHFAPAEHHHALRKPHLARLALPEFGCHFRHALADGFRRLFRCHAVEVRARRRRRRRCVGHLVGYRRGDPDARNVDAELLRHHLRHLEIKPLPHLRAAMVHLDRTIGVDMHQRARLVEMLEREGNAELHRIERNPLLQIAACGIETCDLLAPRAIVGTPLQFPDKLLEDVVLDRHAIGRHVPAFGVEVALADFQRISAELHCDLVHHPLGKHHALRPAKAAKRCVGNRIGLHPVRADANLRIEIGIVCVEHRAVIDAKRQVRRIAAA